MDPVSLASLLPSLIGGLKGGGGSRTSVSTSQNISLALNPVIANQIGGAGGLTASPNGDASGTPYATANSSGNDNMPLPSSSQYGGLSPSYYGTAPYGDLAGIRPAAVQQQATQDDGMMLLLLAGAAVLFLVAK
jgi:hypothetical protein